MERAGNAEHPTRAEALLAEAAVALEIELMTLLRVGNLASLRLGKTIILQRRGRQDCAFIAIAGSEVKNGEGIELELPAPSAGLIRRHVERFLPVLGRPGDDHLFPGLRAGHKGPSIVGGRLTRVIQEAIGHYVNPHLLRHLGGLIYLKDNPGDYETVRRMLGHKSLTTTMKYYVNLETRLAAIYFDRNILDRRQAAKVRSVGRR
jgi:integrase